MSRIWSFDTVYVAPPTGEWVMAVPIKAAFPEGDMNLSIFTTQREAENFCLERVEHMKRLLAAHQAKIVWEAVTVEPKAETND